MSGEGVNRNLVNRDVDDGNEGDVDDDPYNEDDIHEDQFNEEIEMEMEMEEEDEGEVEEEDEDEVFPLPTAQNWVPPPPQPWFIPDPDGGQCSFQPGDEVLMSVFEDILTTSEDEAATKIIDSNTSQYIYEEHSSDEPSSSDSDIIDACTICEGMFKKGQDIRRLKCGHSFHVICVDYTLKREKKCPTCNKIIDSSKKKD